MVINLSAWRSSTRNRLFTQSLTATFRTTISMSPKKECRWTTPDRSPADGRLLEFWPKAGRPSPASLVCRGAMPHWILPFLQTALSYKPLIAFVNFRQIDMIKFNLGLTLYWHFHFFRNRPQVGAYQNFLPSGTFPLSPIHPFGWFSDYWQRNFIVLR